MFAHDQTRACAGGGLRCRFVAISSSLLLAACSHAAATPELSDAMAVDSYGALPDERFPIMAVRQNQLKPEFRRQLVAYETAYPAGTIVVDPNGHYLYLVMPGGQAMR